MENEDIYYLNLMGTDLYYHRSGGFGEGACGFRWAEATDIQHKLKKFDIRLEIISPEEYEEKRRHKQRVEWCKKRFHY